MAMAWTEMQHQAIHKRGGNIIVSAGAGSGKTAVLSERILTYCLEGKDICSFLVLTFTNAAASEMKERIRKKLISNGLIEQASRIDSAFITTFDAYSLALVKKYYFYLGVDKDLSIIDQALLEVKKREIIDTIFLNKYNQGNQQFLSLLQKYTKQNDENVKKIVLSLLKKLELIVDEEAFIETYEQAYFNPDFIDGLVKEFENLALSKGKEIYEQLEKLYHLAEEDSASEKLQNGVSFFLKDASLESYDAAYSWITSITLPRIAPKADFLVKEQKTLCGELLKEIKSTYFQKYVTLAEAKEEIYSTKSDVLYFLELALEVKQKLDAYKQECMAFDYMDIAKMAIRLVKTNPIVLAEIKNSFAEILIDEYQDTSDIQEAFIQCISNENCYMVGDIKQSIYRFRNANPYIFKEKYSQYAHLNHGYKIDLTHNFRSRKEVVENINLIFSNIMTLDYGDANYALDHVMRYGQKDYEKQSSESSYTMDICSYSSLEGYTDEEVEAFICGQQIKQIMKQKPVCLKGDHFEPIKYSDFAILMDKAKSFTVFKRVFEYLGIPLSIEADLSLNDSVLPKLFSNIFLLLVRKHKQLIDTTYYHALASVGRSFLFGYRDEAIYKMLKQNEQNELTSIIDHLAQRLDELPLEELYFLIVEEFQIYEKLARIGDVNNSCVTLEYIHSLFLVMKDASMSMEEASTYFADVFEKGIELKYKLVENTDSCVRMMTIHKSKGLEFPYCLFPMLGSKFNQADIKENFGLSTKYGVYIPYSDETMSNTIIKTLVEADIKKSDLSEKIRLFYVALTRAREKIILISKDLEKEEPIPLHKVMSFNQLLHTKLFFNEFRKPIDMEHLSISKTYKAIKHSIKKIQGSEIKYNSIETNRAFAYKEKISKELTELTDFNLKQAIELGKKFHQCLEVLDFSNPQIDVLPVDDFMKNTLKKVLNTEVFRNIHQAKTYHEHEFYFDTYHGIIDLLCIYEDHIDIIDYKLSNTSSEEYLRQLRIYMEYVKKHSSLDVSCYLLSILKQEIKKVL